MSTDSKPRRAKPISRLDRKEAHALQNAATPSTGSHGVYAALRSAIIEQALRPGQKLPEDAIGRQFNVSRTLVREAIKRLSIEGLVEVERNRGAAVANPSLDEARDVFAVRRGLERMVVASLAGQLTRDHVRDLEAHVALEEAASQKDGPESIRLAGEFHIKLAAITNNALLLRYVREVTSRCSLILAIYGRPHSSECAISEHRQLIRALQAGNVKEALKLSDLHLDAVASRALLARPAPLNLDTALAPYVRNARRNSA
jgi:DNA-binding GntR family transcriptional regulator